MLAAFAFFSCSKGKDDVKPIVPVQSTAKFEAETELFLNQDLAIVNKSESAETYAWDFGDGTKSAEKEPKHKYATAGTYTVKLSTNGNSTVNKVVVVHDVSHNVVIKNNTQNDFKITLFDRIDENTVGSERFKIELLKAGETSKPFFTNKTKISFGGWNSSGFNFVQIEPRFHQMELGKKNVITINSETKVVYGLVVPD